MAEHITGVKVVMEVETTKQTRGMIIERHYNEESDEFAERVADTLREMQELD